MPKNSTGGNIRVQAPIRRLGYLFVFALFMFFLVAEYETEPWWVSF
jgi:hypothetical protein